MAYCYYLFKIIIFYIFLLDNIIILWVKISQVLHVCITPFLSALRAYLQTAMMRETPHTHTVFWDLLCTNHI